MFVQHYSTVSESLAAPLAATHLQPFGKIADSGAQNVEIQPAPPAFVSPNPTELVSSISSGCHLQVLYRYTRSTHLYSPSMVNIELSFVNTGNEELTDIRIASKASMLQIFVIKYPEIFVFSSTRTYQLE